MRFKSSKKNGITVYAVTGTNTVSFAIDVDPSASTRLLGFSVERLDKKENEKYFLKGFKVFQSVVPHPDETTQVSTYEHPVQSCVWDDFTGKPGYTYTYYFYPVKGTPKKLEHLTPVEITVTMEELYSTKSPHQIFFNRGVASSQAYARLFDNKKPSDLTGEKKQQALDWLGRDIPQAFKKFIGQAKRGDSLHGCLYEFSNDLVIGYLKEAIDRGVQVHLILDAKLKKADAKHTAEENSKTRITTLEKLKAFKFPKSSYTLREVNPAAIQHNKFIVFGKKKGSETVPTAVLGGSTNITDGGIYGQANVVHIVNDPGVAGEYLAYWHVVKEHSATAGEADDDRAYKKEIEKLQKTITRDEILALKAEMTPVFSPRVGNKMLSSYIQLLDNAEKFGCVTLAFGITKAFKEELANNTQTSPVLFFLLEKEDKPSKKNPEAYVDLDAKNNIYEAFGAYINNPVYQWTKETDTDKMGINHYVKYVHSKFMLVDPFGDDPILITGSANFSPNSTSVNDENMLIIKSSKRAMDIYFTEFNRLFNHYYFRSLVASATGKQKQDHKGLFLLEDDSWIKTGYKKGSLRRKRIDILKNMKLK